MLTTTLTPSRLSAPRRTLIAGGVLVAAAALALTQWTTSARAACSGTVDVDAKSLPRMFPSLIGGDANFAGHGPSVTVSAKRKLINGPTTDSLIVVVSMRAEETQSDWTRASGSRSYTLYTTPTGCHIQPGSVWFGSFDSNGYLDRGSGPRGLGPGDTDTINPSFVSGYTVYDDQAGNDVGPHTSVRVHTRAFTLRLM
jgi:hypothetical protein